VASAARQLSGVRQDGRPQNGYREYGRQPRNCRRIGFHRGYVDSRFHAFDSKTGKELWTGELEASAFSADHSDGEKREQYILLPAGGGGFLHAVPSSDTLVAFALPETSGAPKK